VVLFVAVVFVLLRVVIAAHGHVDGLVVAGAAHVSRTPYTSDLPIRQGTGYDGQFYFRLALDPLDWSSQAFGIRLDTLGRLDRVTYPAIVWLVSAGQRAAVPVMMPVVNIVALAALAMLCAALSRHAGRHPLWGLLVAGFFGFLWSLGRDLTELTEAVFVVAGLLAVRQGRPFVGGLMLSAAVLAREPALVVVGALFVSRVWVLTHPRTATAPGTRGPGNGTAGSGADGHLGDRAAGSITRLIGGADAAWALPVVAFAAWQLALRAVTGTFPVLTSGNNNVGVPLAGLAGGVAHYGARLPHIPSLLWFGELGVLVLVGTMAAASLRSGTSAALLHERIAWAVAGVLALTLTKGIWLGDVGFRSLDDFYLLSGVLLLFSRVRLDLVGLAVSAAWCVVAFELVLFI
jgi:hypothetical protein